MNRKLSLTDNLVDVITESSKKSKFDSSYKRYHSVRNVNETDVSLNRNLALALTAIDCTKYISHCESETWGSSILIIEKTGKSFGRIYWYTDDNSTVYLDMLSVNESDRNCGLGKEMQELREKIGILLGAKFSCLRVKRDMWMRDWYERRGYKYSIDCEDDKNFVWMRKSLDKPVA